MSILRTLQDYLTSYDRMELRPIREVRTDLTGLDPSSYAIAPAGGGKVSQDIMGNVTYKNDYIFYARECASLEADRAENHDFLESFSHWLDDQNAGGNYPTLPERYTAREITVANAMLFDIDDNGNATYQVQISMQYTKQNEVKNRWLI